MPLPCGARPATSREGRGGQELDDRGVGEPTREAVTAAAQEAGMPLGQWVEQALGKALAEGLEPGVSIEEIEARLRQVVAEAVQPVLQALARLETIAAAASPPRENSSSIRLLRERMRQRRSR